MTRIFINYRTKDKFTKLLHQRLVRQYSVDYIFFDKQSLLTGDDWAAKLEQGVRACDVMISVIGMHWCDTSPSGGIPRLHQAEDWVRKEIEWALETEKPIFPILLDVNRMPNAADLPESIRSICRLQYLTINTDYFEREVEKLISDLEGKVFGEKEVSALEKSKTEIPKYLSIKNRRPPLAPHLVIGRKKELQKIAQSLQAQNRLVLINGLGGVGKTTLAGYYLSQYEAEYDHIAWIAFTGNFKNDLIRSLDQLPYSPSTDAEQQYLALLRALHQLSGNNLLVIDNISTESEADGVLRHERDLPNNLKILMTARVKVQGFINHSIGVLEEAGAIDLFKRHYTFKAGDNEADLKTLLQHIGRHTLVVEMLAKTMTDSGRQNLQRMLQKIQQQGISSIHAAARTARSGNEIKKLNEFVAFVFDLSLDDIAEDNQLLLQQLALLPPLAHPFDLLVKLLTKESETEQDQLDEQFSRLHRKGLIEYEAEQIYLHPVLQEIIKTKASLPYEAIEKLVAQLADLLDYDPQNPRHDLFERQPLMIYGEAVVQRIEHFEEEAVAELFDRLGYLHENFGNYQRAAELKEKSLWIAETLFEAGHATISRYQSNLANVYGYLGHYDKAAELLEKALQSDLENFGENHPSVAVRQSDLALAYRDLKRHEMAAELLKEALQSDLENFGENHPSVAVRQANLASVYQDLGHYQAAANLFKKALQSDLQNFGEKHPTIAVDRSNLAMVYQYLGLYEMAVELLEKAFKSDLKNFGENHPLVAIRLNNLSSVDTVLKKYQLAAERSLRAYKIVNNRLGVEHPHTKKILRSLMHALQKGAASGNAYCQQLLEEIGRNQNLQD